VAAKTKKAVRKHRLFYCRMAKGQVAPRTIKPENEPESGQPAQAASAGLRAKNRASSRASSLSALISACEIRRGSCVSIQSP
jgi:hypothetical protein